MVLRNGETLEVLAANALEDGVDGTPALVGDRLYVRSRSALYCLRADGAGS